LNTKDGSVGGYKAREESNFWNPMIFFLSSKAATFLLDSFFLSQTLNPSNLSKKDKKRPQKRHHKIDCIINTPAFTHKRWTRVSVRRSAFFDGGGDPTTLKARFFWIAILDGFLYRIDLHYIIASSRRSC
jgi:hypothetical protein